MDVLKAGKYRNKIILGNYKLVAGACALIILLGWGAIHSFRQVSVSRNDILVEKVNRGNLDVIIEGYGTLKSNKQQLISSLTQATVKEIVLKPGATVTADSIIVRMENPELNHELASAKLQLGEITANLRQLKINQKREMLDESSAIDEAESNYEKIKLTRSAQEKLVARGIIPSVTFQATVLDEQQAARHLNTLKQRIRELALVQEEAVNVEKERVKQQESLLNIAQSRLDGLAVRAGMDGVLQRVSVELGQSVNAGQEIALIGSATDLVALIRIPQSEAQSVSVGEDAIITARGDEIKGKVARIDPLVESNSVNIEISLPQKLPPSALPQSNVDAKIIAATLPNITYIKRPAKAQANSQAQLYRLDSNQKHAQIHDVKFGRRAGDYIEILAGAQANELFIISDLSNLKAISSKLTLNN